MNGANQNDGHDKRGRIPDLALLCKLSVKGVEGRIY